MSSSLKQKQQAITATASQKQQEAADPNYSVWVSASAGTGKTKILTDRVLRILLSGVRANRILCITFTKAAAAEMNDRISNHLAKWASMDALELISDLQAITGEQTIGKSLQNKARSLFAEILETPGGMRIQTVHSFCQHILERFPREAGVPPNFKTLDELEDENLLLEARNDIFELLLEDPKDLNIDQQRLITCLQLLLEYKSESSLTSMLKIARYHQKELHNLSNLSYEELQKLLADYLSIDLSLDIQAIEQPYIKQLQQNKETFATLLQIFIEIGTKTEKETLAPKLEYALYHSDNPMDLIEFLFTSERAIRSLKFLPSAKIKKQHPDLEQFVQQQAELLEDFLEQKAKYCCLSFSLAFNYAAIHIINGWQQKKLQHMRLSFDDLIFYTSRLLNQAPQRKWVQYKLDSSIDHILIDEAQDTNPMQWEVLRALYEDFFDGDGIQEQNQRTLFVVGDFKQSIYRFQGARAELFQAMQQDFENRTSDKAINAKVVDLNINFRSTRPILEFTDALINHTDARQGVHNAEQPLEHMPQRILEAGQVEFWPLIYADDEDEENIKPRPAVEKIAEAIAERIHQLINERYWLYKENRPAHAGDFLILLKKRNPLAIPLIRALGRKNIKTMGSDRLDIFQHLAVQDLLALARFMLQPSDDYSLACILRSPLFDISEDDLFTLSHKRGDQPLFQTLKKYADQNIVFETAFHKLEYWRKIVDFRTVFEFFSEVLYTGNFERFITRLGIEAEDALTEFLSFILSWEQQNTSLLELFMRNVNRSDEIKREQHNNDVPAVRIMTVHGAKGLQAPIVILPDQYNVRMKNDTTGLQLHQQYGHSFLLSSPEKPQPEVITNYKEQENQQNLDESHRLLYVAATRAEYKLIIAGYHTKPLPKKDAKDPAKNPWSWYQTIESLWKSEHAPEYRISNEIHLPFLEEKPFVMECSGIGDKVQNFDAFTPRKLAPLPEFFYHAPATEQKPYNPLTAGRVLDDSEIPARSPLDGVKLNLIFNRGNIIHKLLEILPNIDPAQQEAVAYSFLERKIWELSKQQQDAIYQEVNQLLNHKEFAPLFSQEALAEVPISGIIDDDIITGRIDRLWMDDDQILIIDFKSNRNVPATVQSVPKLYKRQLEIYKILLQQIYPNKTIRAALLWTYSAKLMEISDRV